MPVRDELGAIGLKGITRTLPAGAELYRQGGGCGNYFVVLSGWIALSVLLDDGACQILDFALPGAFLGFPLAPAVSMYHSARCLTPVQVRAYPRSVLNDAIGHNSSLALLLCRLAGIDESRAHDHLVNLGLRSARERVANLLVELYVRLHGRVPAARGETIPIPLTQDQIGQALSLTGVHVSRTLRMLREQRIAHLTKRGLLILDPGALLRAAGWDHYDGTTAGEPRTSATGTGLRSTIDSASLPRM